MEVDDRAAHEDILASKPAPREPQVSLPSSRLEQGAVDMPPKRLQLQEEEVLWKPEPQESNPLKETEEQRDSRMKQSGKRENETQLEQQESRQLASEKLQKVPPDGGWSCGPQQVVQLPRLSHERGGNALPESSRPVVVVDSVCEEILQVPGILPARVYSRIIQHLSLLEEDDIRKTLGVCVVPWLHIKWVLGVSLEESSLLTLGVSFMYALAVLLFKFPVLRLWKKWMKLQYRLRSTPCTKVEEVVQVFIEDHHFQALCASFGTVLQSQKFGISPLSSNAMSSVFAKLPKWLSGESFFHTARMV